MAIFFWVFANCAAGADVVSTWLGGTGNWSDSSKWNTNPAFPNNGNGGLTYDAIVNGGTATLDQTIAVQAFTFGGGTVNGSGNLTIQQIFNWSSGAMSGSGETTIAPGATLNLQGTNTLNRNLTNNGNVTWGGGLTFAINNATFQNNGTFTANGNSNLNSTNSAFNNAGTFNHPNNFLDNLSIPFHNSGIVNVGAGILNLTGGGTHSGDFSGLTGAELVSLARTPLRPALI